MILAPVAREKKGEFLELFAEMQAQGFVRFRINGNAYEFDDLPALKKTEQHVHQLRDAGNTIVVIEHNLDVIKTAD
jgi:excinuclease UvrABC ATPase subunit